MQFSLSKGRFAPTLFVAAAAAALALPTVTLAQAPAGPDDVLTVYVATHGLDLSRPADLRRLRHRIDGAVDHICGEPWNLSFEQSMRVDDCRRHTAQTAEPQVAALVRHDVELAARDAAHPAG